MQLKGSVENLRSLEWSGHKTVFCVTELKMGMKDTCGIEIYFSRCLIISGW
jgi:hypothetical protein